MSGEDRSSKVTLPVKESLSVVEWVCPGRTGFEDYRRGAGLSWESRSSRLPSWRWLVRGGQVFETAIRGAGQRLVGSRPRTRDPGSSRARAAGARVSLERVGASRHHHSCEPEGE
ncbi:unnamed protein product, partial [Ixodes pacificus]